MPKCCANCLIPDHILDPVVPYICPHCSRSVHFVCLGGSQVDENAFSSLHLSIRNFWYQQTCSEWAKKYVTNAQSKLRKAHKPEMSPIEAADLNKTRISKNMAKFNPNRIMSFPVEWLTFLFIGKPDYILLGTKNAFNSGQEVPNQSNVPEGMKNRGQSGMNANRPNDSEIILDKAVRKHAQSLKSYCTSEKIPSSSQKAAQKKTPPEAVRHEHTHNIPGLVKVSQKESFLARLPSSSSSITESTQGANTINKDKIQRSEFVLHHIKKQKQMYTESIARHAARGNATAVEEMNRKYDVLDLKEGKIRDEMMAMMDFD